MKSFVGTSHSQISRIESGRHRTNLDTLSRIALTTTLDGRTYAQPPNGT